MNQVGWLVFVQRGAQAIYGLVTVLLIAHYLSPEAQGWYYSLLSFASVYTLFDLGYSVALVPFFARFFSHQVSDSRGKAALVLPDAITPVLSRVLRWYGLIVLLFFVGVLPAGWWFFSHIPEGQLITDWAIPWFILVVATGIMLFWMPLLALLEGAGYMASVTRVRFVQLTLGSLGCWMALYLGSGAWAAVSVTLSHALVFSGWLIGYWPGLMQKSCQLLFRPVSGDAPFKSVPWRVAVSWGCAYLTSQIFTLMLMRIDGPVAAGQFALSLTLVSMVGVLALSSMAGRVALVGQAAAQGDWRTFRQALKQDIKFFASFYGLVFGGVVLLFWLLDGSGILNRFLPMEQTLGLLVFTFVTYLLNLMATYVRAFLREPFAKVYLVGTLLALPIAYWAAAYYSALGIVWVLVSVAMLWFLPMSVWVFRRELALELARQSHVKVAQ